MDVIGLFIVRTVVVIQCHLNESVNNKNGCVGASYKARTGSFASIKSRHLVNVKYCSG
jgi:hypothetical protein